MGRKSVIPELEQKIGQNLKSWMTGRINEGKSPDEIGDMLGIGKSKLYELIKEFGLKDMIKQARKDSQTSGGEFLYYWNKYMEEKRIAGLSKRTIGKDEALGRLYMWWLREFNKPTDLNAIKNPDIIKEFFNYLATETNRFGKKRKGFVSAMGQQSYRKQLIAFVHWLQKQEIISSESRANPFTKIMKIKVPKKLPEDIPDLIIEKVLNSFGDNSFIDVRDKTIFTWFLETGQRLGGVAGIKLNHFNWQTGVGTVVEKGKKQRTIVLSEKLKQQVEKYMEIRARFAKCDYLWIEGNGTRLEDRGIYYIFQKLDKEFREDMEKHAPPGQSIHPHAMRHVWAKHLALSEVPGFAMMVMAGWENLQLVQHYAAAYTQEKAWSYINTASPLSKAAGG